MEILARNGQRNEALAVYERCRRLFNEELGMDPAARTTELYEQILAGDLRLDSLNEQGVRGYELQDEIGSGAYGVIHRSVQPVIGREVAVKIIRRRYANDPDFIRRFEAEAQTIARLEHPHIVPIYDFWRDPDGAYLVMRLLRGGNLLTALAQGPWSLERAQKLVDQIAPPWRPPTVRTLSTATSSRPTSSSMKTAMPISPILALPKICKTTIWARLRANC